jgi:hypothetical protein
MPDTTTSTSPAINAGTIQAGTAGVVGAMGAGCGTTAGTAGPPAWGGTGAEAGAADGATDDTTATGFGAGAGVSTTGFVSEGSEGGIGTASGATTGTEGDIASEATGDAGSEGADVAVVRASGPAGTDDPAPFQEARPGAFTSPRSVSSCNKLAKPRPSAGFDIREPNRSTSRARLQPVSARFSNGLTRADAPSEGIGLG